jgi:cytochrome c oxidase assembly protein subunit 15
VVTGQAVLGVATLLHVAPLGLSLAHQGLAVIVLTAAVLHAEGLHHAGTRPAAKTFSVEQGVKTR